jgi:multicomponent Na+:H+ antiporter subunit C
VEGVTNYSNPLPHVLILTAIVVGIATTSLALALVIRIKEAYGTVQEDEIIEKDQNADHGTSSEGPVQDKIISEANKQ